MEEKKNRDDDDWEDFYLRVVSVSRGGELIFIGLDVVCGGDVCCFCCNANL
jgi:hypothetical protein